MPRTIVTHVAQGRSRLRRLPEGNKCKEGTCVWDHGDSPCYRSPEYDGSTLTDKQWRDVALIERLNVQKEDNAQRLGRKLTRLQPRTGSTPA